MRHFLLIAGVTACAFAHALVLDDFTTGFASASTKVDANYDVAAGTPGGHRSVDHDFITNMNNRSVLTELDQADPGHFYIESGSNVNAMANIYYAGRPLANTPNDRPYTFADFDGLGGVDLSGFNAFKVSYEGNDQASTGLMMRVIDQGGNISVFSGTTLAAGDGMALVSFASFVGAADWSDLDGIHLGVALPDGNDITLTNFEAVPEPATLAVVGLGIAALARRKRKQA